MKTLEIPYLPQLESADMEAAVTIMEESAVRNSIDCCNWPESFPYCPITSFDIAYSDNYLYIHFFVRGNYLRAVCKKDNELVYQDSCVEFFIRPEDDMKYYNLEFNCIGTAYGAYGEGRDNRSLLSLEQLALIKRYTSLYPRPFNEMEGLFAWEVLFAIPFEIMGMDKNNLPDSFRANIYKCADETSAPHYLSWAPIPTEQPDFHRPEYFGRMTFKKKN